VEQENRRELHKGNGWRIGWQPESRPHCALVGSDDWALELTDAEWQAFCQGMHQLQGAIASATGMLVAEEAITLEYANPLLTLIATGLPPAFSIYLQLHSGRRGEGYWSSEAVTDLMAAAKSLEEND
jgi:hypothetical protein